MVTLHDVSKEAGVSIATVSLYINGKSKGRISEDTQNIIQKAIEKTGYKPAHKKNKILYKSSKTIAIFWSIDSRISFIGSNFAGIQDAIMSSKYLTNYDFIIHPFKSDELYKKRDVLIGREYSGALIANTSLADIQYLRSMTLDIPVVLLNRNIKSQHSVYIDNYKIAESAAKLIKEKGYTSVAIVNGKNSSLMITERVVNFIEYCKKYNIDVPNEAQFMVEDSMYGGREAAINFLKLEEKPQVIFTSTDIIAYGVENLLCKNNIKIPNEVAILCFGFDSTEITEFSPIPISSIDLSVYKIAKECVKHLIYIIENDIKEPIQKEIDYEINLRNSL